MKTPRLVLFVAAVALGLQPLFAQEADVTADVDSTIVTSDAFRLDQSQHQGIFTGNVVVSSKNFRLKTRELTVFFSQGVAPAGSAVTAGSSKVERLVARGDVQIDMDGRTATSAEAEYTVVDGKVTLTGTPQITQGKDVITGTTITLYRADNRLEVDGRSRMVIGQPIGGPAPA